MTYSRQEIVKVLHRAGMDDIAAAALATLPEHVDDKGRRQVLCRTSSDPWVRGGPDGRQSVNVGRGQ